MLPNMSAEASEVDRPIKTDKTEKPLSTEREKKLLEVAWQCLKSFLSEQIALLQQ